MNMEEKNKIKFKPLHEGMGFHPFSDGLPYAPESNAKETKSKYQNGSGANAAGRPQFVTSKAPMASTVAPAVSNAPKMTARQIQERNATTANAQIPSLAITTHEPLSRSQAKPQNPKAASTTAPVQTVVPGSLLRRRAFAYLLDTVIHAGFWLATNLAALFLFKFQVDSEIIKENFGQFLIFFLLSQWLFIGLQEVLFENSIGKVFFNLEFKHNHHSLFLRSLVFMLGALCLGLGFYYRPQDKLGEIQLKTKHYA
jgi:hypothetical protein